MLKRTMKQIEKQPMMEDIRGGRSLLDSWIGEHTKASRNMFYQRIPHPPRGAKMPLEVKIGVLILN